MLATSQKSVPGHVAAEHVFDFDIYEDPQLKSNLHAAYSRLQREAPPVFYTPANGGHWMVTRHDLMAEIVKDFEHFSARESQIPRVPNPPLMLPLNLDPPEHTWYRQVLAPHFGPRAVTALEGDLRKFAAEIVAGVAARGECEFVRDVAAPFPVTAFMRMMGLPLERFDEFRQLAENFFRAVGPEQIGQAANAIAGVLAQIIGDRVAQPDRYPKDDLLAHFMASKINGEPILPDKLVAMCFLLFLGGLDTVTNAATFAMRHLAGDAALQQRLQDDPALVPQFMEEGLRLFGVVNTPRLVVKDCERFGVRFKVGDMVLCPLPMAGWDDSKNGDSDRFDVDRKNRSYLTFSTGPHLCLGHFLARTELRVLYGEWMKQVGSFSLAPGYQPAYRAGMVMSLESLPLRWTPKAS